MKKSIKQFITLILTSVMFYSCGDNTSLENIDDGIESEEDVANAMIKVMTVHRANLNQALTHFEALKELSDKGEDIYDAIDDIEDVMDGEDIGYDDVEDAENFEQIENLRDDLNDLENDLEKVYDDINFRYLRGNL